MTIIQNYLQSIWQILLELSPWLLLGMIIAGILHILLPPGFIKKHLGGKRFSSVIKAVTVGIPMPLCSCGVIPTAIGLKKDGASNGAATGFLISTPQTGVDSILVCASFLGLPFALFKVASALVSGLIGGVLVNLFDKDTPAPATAEQPSSCCCHSKPEPTPEPEPEKPSCCSSQKKTENNNAAPDRSLKEAFRFAFDQLLRDIYGWLIIGILIAAAITTFVPDGALAEMKWTQGLLGMIAMLLISLPMYVCATASVPLAASLIIAGMSPGSALVFLMAGPTTNAATVGAIFKSFGKRVTTIYIATVAILSIALGMMFDWIITSNTAQLTHQHEQSSIVHTIAAVALCILLAWFASSDLKKKFKKS